MYLYTLTLFHHFTVVSFQTGFELKSQVQKSFKASRPAGADLAMRANFYFFTYDAPCWIIELNGTLLVKYPDNRELAGLRGELGRRRARGSEDSSGELLFTTSADCVCLCLP